MKIAIPTNDGTTISGHFGRSAAFLIFEVEDGTVTSRELRPNGQQHEHTQGSCGNHSHTHAEHSHAGILSALEGCQLVLCAGMGRRAADDLKAAGMTVLFTNSGQPAEALVGQYVRGELATTRHGACQCSHGEVPSGGSRD